MGEKVIKYIIFVNEFILGKDIRYIFSKEKIFNIYKILEGSSLLL